MHTPMRKILGMGAGFALAGFWFVSTAQAGSFNVVPFEFDPGKTHLVSAQWARGVGCPPTGTTALIDDPSTPFVFDPIPTPYDDPACAIGDPQDKLVEGLLLVKTGPTPNFAAAVADLKGLKGTVLTELGYDIRKIAAPPDDRGSHCGAGAPRFNVVIGGVLYFLGCNSPPPTVTTLGTGWLRLQWGPCPTPLQAFDSTTFALVDLCTIPGGVDAIAIVFDEGQDASGGPDQFGAAVLDNINVNGSLVGRGPAGGR